MLEFIYSGGVRAGELSARAFPRPVLGEPLAHRSIVQLIGAPSDEQGDGKGADAHHDVGAHRSIGVTELPAGLHVDERIVRDVKRIGYVAEETAEGQRALSGKGASGSHG